jgi:hypothetical protein
MNHTRVLIDVASRKFSFGFVPNCGRKFSLDDMDAGAEVYLRHFCEEALKIASASETWPDGIDLESLVAEFPVLFSSTFATAMCAPYETELTDPTPVHSPPYWCAPPKMEIFREMIDDLLEQGVVRPRKSPYARPAFLVPKSGRDFRMVVVYRKVNQRLFLIPTPYRQ